MALKKYFEKYIGDDDYVYKVIKTIHYPDYPSKIWYQVKGVYIACMKKMPNTLTNECIIFNKESVFDGWNNVNYLKYFDEFDTYKFRANLLMVVDIIKIEYVPEDVLEDILDDVPKNVKSFIIENQNPKWDIPVKKWKITSYPSAISSYKNELEYITGKIVYPDSFDKRLGEICTNGIHYFKTIEQVFLYYKGIKN
jgi:hypothetical protein